MNDATIEGLRHPSDDGRTCCHCGGSQFRLLDAWEPGHPRNSASIPVGIWECECKLAVLHPVPTSVELPDDGDWWSPKRKQIYRRPRFKRLRAKVLNTLFGTPIHRLIRQTRQAKSSGRLLDVGCGKGELLDVASPYFECEGLEPSELAAEQLRDRGFKVIADFFEPAAIESGGYDVVTMDSVLEHVADPVDVLRKVNRILRPGGVVAVKVPKLWGPSHRRHGREWNGYRVGYHLTMFSGETMDAVMDEAGFTGMRHPRRDRMLDDILIVWGKKVREVQERDYADSKLAVA